VKKLLIGSSALIVLILSGCTGSTEPSPQVTEATVNKPINCTTAEADISTLTSQKQSDQAVSGLLSITPVGLLTNAATSPDDKEKASIEEHNKMIDAKIADIKKTCNIK